ncbi:retrovirus-related pol polyprotein from transposon TNT 1-94 [Tanacetum coccineum]
MEKIIMKSINEGPFHMGTVSDVIAAGTEGAVQTSRQLYHKNILNSSTSILTTKRIWDNRDDDSGRNKATVQDGRVVVLDVRGRYNANNQGRPFQRNNARGNVVAGMEAVRTEEALLILPMENGAVLDEEQSLFLAGEQVTNFDDDVDDSPENDLALNVDHIFEADQYSTLMLMRLLMYKTHVMVNLSSEDHNLPMSSNCTLFKEVKVMEEIFDQMNDEVDQNTIDKQCAEIVKKNLLIANYLEAEMSKVHNESKHISKLEREYVKLQLKYQHIQESFDNDNSQTSQEALDFNLFFKIKNLEHQIQEKDNVIRDLKVLVSNVNDRSCETYNAKDVTALIEQNECVRVELEKVKQHYKELSKTTSTEAADRALGSNTRKNMICMLRVVQVILWYLDSGCSKHMTGNRSKLKNFVEKFIGTVRFGNDHFGAIMGYGDYVIGDSVISRVYYVEGLRHNLFSVGQFCDSDLEVAFRKHSCFVHDINGADLLKGGRSTNLYTISIDDMMKSSPICLLGLPRLKFEKDHLCSACQLRKSKKFSHKPKSENTNIEVLHTLHMDLCGPMRVQSIKGKKYILVIMGDYSRFTWVMFLRSKDETPVFVINFLKQIQVGLNKIVRYIRTDNGTEFINQVMSKYYEGVVIFHQKSVPRTPQQNGVVERRNRTLVEAARTMLIFSKAPIFLWEEAIATAYLGKFQAKVDIGIFVGYAPSRKGYRIYNKRTHRLMEIIHVTFDEMHQTMAPVRMSSGPEPFIMTPGQLKSGLAPTDKELEMLFQPMFDEYLEQSRVNEPVPSATAVNTQVVPPGTSLSTTIAQDAPSTSASSSTSDMHHPVRHQGIAEETTLEDSPITHDALHPSFYPVTGEPSSAQSTSGDVSLAEPNQVTQPPDHLRRWTKDHPLDNIVGNPSRPVSTRKQLASDALWCCFHTELSKVEPKNFKMAVIEDCWFQAMIQD